MAKKPLEFLLEPGYYCLFSFHLLKIMTPLEAVFLMFLYNYKLRSGQTGKWFRCPMEVIMKEMRINHTTQTNLIKKLSERGFLRTKMQGMPAKRYLCHDFEKVAEVIEPLLNNRGTLDSLNSGTQDYIKTGSHKKEELRKNTNTSYSLRNGRTELFSGDTSNEFDHSCAKKLHHTLLTTKKIYLGSKPKTWYKHFTTLRKHHSPEEITSVLDWFITHIKDQYTPHAYTAHHFVIKFDQIKKIMNFKANSNSVPPVTNFKVPSKLQPLIDMIESQGWPGQTEHLDVAIAKSYQNAKVFLKASNTLVDDESYPNRRFLNLITNAYSGYLDQFIRDWFESVREEVNNWAKWKGNLGQYIFSFDNENFQKQLRSRAKEWSNDPREELNLFKSRITGLMRKGQL